MARGSVSVVLAVFGAGFTAVIGAPGCDRAMVAADVDRRCCLRLRASALER